MVTKFNKIKLVQLHFSHVVDKFDCIPVGLFYIMQP